MTDRLVLAAAQCCAVGHSGIPRTPLLTTKMTWREANAAMDQELISLRILAFIRIRNRERSAAQEARSTKVIALSYQPISFPILVTYIKVILPSAYEHPAPFDP
jgi:hypothetical protein